MRSLREGIEAGNGPSSYRHSSKRPTTIKASSFMTEDVYVLHGDQSIAEAIQMLVKRRISGAPVLGDQGKLEGILSEYDCMKALAASSFHHEGMPMMRQVKDLMTRDLHAVEPDTDLFSIAHLFVDQRIRRVPVVSANKLVGLISRRDVLRVMGELYT